MCAGASERVSAAEEEEEKGEGRRAHEVAVNLALLVELVPEVLASVFELYAEVGGGETVERAWGGAGRGRGRRGGGGWWWWWWWWCWVVGWVALTVCRLWIWHAV